MILPWNEGYLWVITMVCGEVKILKAGWWNPSSAHRRLDDKKPRHLLVGGGDISNVRH